MTKKSRKQKLIALFIGLSIAVSTAFLGGCSTIPAASLTKATVNYEIIGYVGDFFNDYSEAYKEAKEKFPNADAVVCIKANLGDKTIPGMTPRTLGYYAVKFTDITKKGFFG